MKRSKIYWSIGGLLLISLGIVAFQRIRATNKIIVNNEEVIISQPSKWFKSDVVLLFGGLNYATPEWMLGQLPDTLLKKYTFVIVPHKTSVSRAQELYKEYLNRGLKDKNTIIVGFSAGAKPVQEAYSSKFKLVGLIDPSTNSTLANKEYSSNTILSYNSSNWSSLPAIKSVLPILKQKVLEGGGIAEDISLSHKEFVKYFFKKYM